MLSTSSSNFPLGVDARLYPPPLDLVDGDKVWPRFRRREVEAVDTDEGSGKDFKELLDTIWGSSMAPRAVDFLLLAVGLVPVERCGRPNAKPIAATPTVPDTQSCQTVNVSSINLGNDCREGRERQAMHSTPNRVTFGRGIGDPQSSHEIGNPPMGLPPLPPPA